MAHPQRGLTRSAAPGGGSGGESPVSALSPPPDKIPDTALTRSDTALTRSGTAPDKINKALARPVPAAMRVRDASRGAYLRMRYMRGVRPRVCAAVLAAAAVAAIVCVVAYVIVDAYTTPARPAVHHATAHTSHGSTLGTFGVILLVAVAALLAYEYSLWRHPRRDCHGCGGSGRHSGAVWNYSRGDCRRCDGKGKFPRWGIRLLHKSRYNDLTGK